MISKFLKGMLAFAFLAAAGIIQPGYAQERQLPPAVMGFFGMYEYGHAFPVKNSVDITSDPYANKAQSAGAGITFIFPKIVTNGLGISTSISYGRYALTAGEEITESIFDLSGVRINGQVHHDYSFESQALQMDLLAYVQIGDLARFEIGPWVGAGFLPRITDSKYIVDPGSGMFAGGGFSQTQTGYDASTAVLTAGGLIRASLEIPLPGGMALVPSAHLRVGAIVPNQGNNLGAMGMFGGGLAILFGQTRGVIVAAPPISALDSAPPVSSLKARVDLYSRDLSGNHRDTLVLVTRKTLHRMEVPLTADFYFEQNSAALPARYTGYTAETHHDFTLDAFADKGPAVLNRQGLNVIGMRLAAAPTAAITITGVALADEPKWFASARADAVGQYLTRTWGVRPNQLNVNVANPATAVRLAGLGRVVTITSATPGILNPIATEWIEQEVNAAPIGLEPQITAPKGVREWHASIRQGDREIGIVRNTDSTARGALSVSGLMATLAADGSVPNLRAELVVEDSTGATTVASDELGVLVTGETAGGSADEALSSVSSYFLMGLPGDETDRSIQRIAASMGDSASVSLIPLHAEDASRGSGRLQERMRFVADRLQEDCAALGKHHVAITAGDVSAQPAGDQALDSDMFASPIEVRVEN